MQSSADLSLQCDKGNQQNRKYLDWTELAGSRTAGIEQRMPDSGLILIYPDPYMVVRLGCIGDVLEVLEDQEEW